MPHRPLGLCGSAARRSSTLLSAGSGLLVCAEWLMRATCRGPRRGPVVRNAVISREYRAGKVVLFESDRASIELAHFLIVTGGHATR